MTSLALLSSGAMAQEKAAAAAMSSEPSVAESPDSGTMKRADKEDMAVVLKKMQELGIKPAEKRAAVLSMLDAHPELSDRQIGRRLGVSPQTVNTWRKKRGGSK